MQRWDTRVVGSSNLLPHGIVGHQIHLHKAGTDDMASFASKLEMLCNVKTLGLWIGISSSYLKSRHPPRWHRLGRPLCSCSATKSVDERGRSKGGRSMWLAVLAEQDVSRGRCASWWGPAAQPQLAVEGRWRTGHAAPLLATGKAAAAPCRMLIRAPAGGAADGHGTRAREGGSRGSGGCGRAAIGWVWPGRKLEEASRETDATDGWIIWPWISNGHK